MDHNRLVNFNSKVFKDIPQRFEATRYHSLIALKEYFPEELKITAETNDGLIMGFEHKKYPIYGVQFHPESIVTEYGKKMMKNFLGV